MAIRALCSVFITVALKNIIELQILPSRRNSIIRLHFAPKRISLFLFSLFCQQRILNDRRTLMGATPRTQSMFGGCPFERTPWGRKALSFVVKALESKSQGNAITVDVPCKVSLMCSIPYSLPFFGND